MSDSLLAHFTVGVLSLTVLATAYLLVLSEERLAPRKPQPVAIAAGMIRVPIAAACRRVNINEAVATGLRLSGAVLDYGHAGSFAATVSGNDDRHRRQFAWHGLSCRCRTGGLCCKHCVARLAQRALVLEGSTWQQSGQ